MIKKVNALELKSITRRWPGGEPVFSNLSLSVLQGSISCLLGPSGCGKSTLLRCAASLDAVESGETYINGTIITEPSAERQLILQDDRQLFPWMNVRDNVSFPMRHGSAGRYEKMGTADSEELLEMVGMGGAEALYPSQLSGGMKQRAILARALAADPKILLLDEPFGALDSEIRKRLHRVLLEIHRERGLTILLVTHDVSEALILADTIIYMNYKGDLSPSEANPLDDKQTDGTSMNTKNIWTARTRNMESPEFYLETLRMRRRYESLLEPVDN